MKLLKSDYQTLVDILFTAQKRVVISFPNITVHLAEALVKLKERGIEIAVFLEINEDSYRHGYGEIDGLNRLIGAGIDLHDRQEINVYFLIADNTGYFYFPKSRFHEAEGVAYDLVPMVEKQVKDITILFLGPDEITDVNYDGSFDDFQLYEFNHLITQPEKQDIENVIQEVKRNPPPKPDHKRLLDVYQTKYQYVDLKFKGVKFYTKKIKIPSDAIPFKDQSVKRSIEVNLKMFEDLPERDFMKEYNNLIEDFECFRKSYLFRIKSLNKSLIEKSKKAEFESLLKKFKEHIDGTTTNISNHLEKEIESIQRKIRDSLIKSLNESDIGYTYNSPFSNSPENLAARIVNKINFPKTKDFFKELDITCFYSEITWEDLNNNEVTQEMESLGLLDENERAYISQKAIGAEDDD